MHPEMWIVTHFFFLADSRLLRYGVDTPFLFSIRYISRLGYAHFYCQQGHLISSPCHVFSLCCFTLSTLEMGSQVVGPLVRSMCLWQRDTSFLFLKINNLRKNNTLTFMHVL
jgi:hypothetical protein